MASTLMALLFNHIQLFISQFLFNTNITFLKFKFTNEYKLIIRSVKITTLHAYDSHKKIQVPFFSFL